MEKKLPGKRIIPNDLFFKHVKERLEAGQKVKIPVLGRSMEPFLRNGDTVVLKKYMGSEPRIGDIVLAYFNGAYILHRIVKIKNKSIVLAGDGNLQQEELIVRKDIVAVVIKAFREDKVLKINTVLSKVWYKIRFFRSVYSKVFKKKI